MGLGFARAADTHGSVGNKLIFPIDKRKFMCYTIYTNKERN